MNGPGSASHRTFRDPAGSTQVRPEGVFREVRLPFIAETLRFLEHPVAKLLVAQGRLIDTTILPTESFRETAWGAENHPSTPYSTSLVQAARLETLQLQHSRIPFVSYPWEWPPALWLSAAELTLNLATDLLREGWTLKDATPLNVLFRGSRPVFVDLLSIEQANPTKPIWLAYGQFVRTFLLPLLAYRELGWPLHALSMHRDGYEPEEIYRFLPAHKRLLQPALSAVTLPVFFASRQGTAKKLPRYSQDAEVNQRILLKTYRGLLEQIGRVSPPARTSTWTDYSDTATHYSPSDHNAKHEFVSAVLGKVAPRRVLDVGCNTGIYSRLAATAGASVVAIDADAETVNRLALSLSTTSLDILPLCVDLAHPTPSAGWDNEEYTSFLARATGHFDLVMMLAVMHHLLLSSQIPLDRIAALCDRLTTHSLIIEWIPAEDLKFQQLLRGRGSLYTHLTEMAFRRAFAIYFHIAEETTLGNGRILFHFTKAVS